MIINAKYSVLLNKRGNNFKRVYCTDKINLEAILAILEDKGHPYRVQDHEKQQLIPKFDKDYIYWLETYD